MAITFHISNPHPLFLVSTYHRRACRECPSHSSRTLLCHPIFLCALFQPTSPLRPARTAHPARRLHRSLYTSYQLECTLHGLQRISPATRQVHSTRVQQLRHL